MSMMSNPKFESLRGYLETLDNKGLLTLVEDADWNLEIGAISETVAFSNFPHSLLFDSIKGYPKGFRVATDLYVSGKLQAIALGLPDDVSGVKLVEFWRKRSRDLKPLPPQIVSDGPILENVMEGDEVDVLKFPTPIWHKRDGGRYIGTGDLVITKDPEEGWVNVGVYRSMVHDKKTIALQISPARHGGFMIEKYWAKGKHAPVVIVLGQDPYVYWGACYPFLWGQPELDYAGWLKGEPIKVLMDEGTGLPIPAHAEIVIVGHVPPKSEETRIEGPFGECTGYYTETGPERVVRIDKILYRNDPILQGSPCMHGSAMMHSLGAELSTSAAIWDSIEKQVPSVTGVYSLYQPCQCGSSITAIAIKQSFAGHSKQTGLAALSSRACVMTNKMIVVVDEDVDPSNLEEVLFAVTSRCNPAEDVQIINGIPSWPLDPNLPAEKRAIKEFTSSTMIIDATRKPFSLRDKFPRVNAVEKELKQEIIAKWGSKLYETGQGSKLQIKKKAPLIAAPPRTPS